MTSDRETLSRIGSWMEDGRTRLPSHVLDAVLDQLPSIPQRRPWWSGPRMGSIASRARLTVAAVAIAAISVAGLSLFRQPAIGPVASPTSTPRIAPSQSVEAPPATRQPSIGLGSQVPCKKPSSETGVVLGCSRDGTRLLIQKDNENLFVLDADGSETQVTEQLTGFNDIVGSGRPAGATISPDGRRVVFAGLTTRGKSCHNGALFGVDVDGGPTKVLFTSQVQQNGIVRYPRFSPDGTRIAFADGYCDQSHGVWVMNADGTDAHQIVPTDFGPLGATHVHDLAWSKTGDRIAIVLDDGPYAFAPDGSGFARLTSGTDFCFMAPQC